MFFDAPDFDAHEAVHFAHDPETGLNAIIAIHSTHLGPAAGGCRWWAYADDAAALKDALRRDAAIAHLAQPELTLPEIAQRLGFSEASTFHRAFKKWTGVAPGEYRLTRMVAPPAVRNALPAPAPAPARATGSP